MQTVTKAEIAAWGSCLPHTCIIRSSSFSADITEANIVTGSFVLDRKSASGSNIELGSVIAAELVFSLNNVSHKFDSYVFKGKYINVFVSVTDTSGNAYQERLGTFIIDSSTRTKNTVDIVAYDRMVKFDKAYNNGFTFPMTLPQIVDACCTACNVPNGMTSSSYSGYPNTTVSITSADLSGKTYRQILSYALTVMGMCGYCNEEGNFIGQWYKNYPNSTIAEDLWIVPANRTSFNTDMEILTCGGVVVNDTTYTNTSTVNPNMYFSVSNNPFITDSNQATVSQALADFLIENVIYTPASATVLPRPYMWPMVNVELDPDSTVYTYWDLCITGVTFKLNGMTTLECVGEIVDSDYHDYSSGVTTSEQTAIANMTKLTQTNDVLADALTLSKGVYFFSGSGSSYTGDVPTTNAGYGVFVVFVRNSTSIYVLSVQDGHYSNRYTSSGWAGWK